MKKIFRFFSSIRLAIPLLLVLILSSAIGTILESLYGIETAQIWVYQSNWFFLLFVLLFVNIFSATLSRVPFQRHHTGFVITHLGLLILLVGAFLTYQFGIDGTLSVQEGESSNIVLQKELSFQIKATPVESENPSDQPAVGFLLKSAQFQQVGELLYYPDHTEIDFGPLQIFLLKDTHKKHHLFLHDRQTGDILKEFDLGKVKEFTHSGFIFKINRLYERAVVGEKGLQEGTQINPAVELIVSKNGKKQKEILFAYHPEFQMGSVDYPGFQLRYDEGLGNRSQGGRAIGLLPISKEKALVRFYENQKIIHSQELFSGKSIQTPWMGIELILGSVFPHARIAVEKGSKKIFTSKKVHLPLEIKLEEFLQINYPGTQKAKEYKSKVILNGRTQHEISMNNPLKFQDHTVYQSSYELLDGQKPISIFSVSSDPGRFVKYVGSLILAIGIIIYTLMRSRVFQKKREEITVIQLFSFLLLFSSVDYIPVQNNGRIKPLHTLARESMLFISGKYQGPDFYLDLIHNQESPKKDLINIRSVALRKKLNLDSKKTHFSLEQIEKTNLFDLAEPLLSREKQSPEEKEILESFHQVWMLKRVISGEHFLNAVDFSFSSIGSHHSEVLDGAVRNAAQNFILGSVIERNKNAESLIEKIIAQERPSDIELNQTKIAFEVIHNKAQPFFWSAIGYILSAILIFIFNLRRELFLLLPFIAFHLFGFLVRTWITGFSPVTNMYGTMLWVSLGVVIFSLVFHRLYQNKMLTSLSLFGAGLVLTIAEAFPLSLSPDLDPLVAVLRSNLWLTAHVLTITISYAALTMTMMIGNLTLILSIFHKLDSKFIESFFHYSYRLTQLGCFLLTVGIILGGVWADYSWGRFWGWDPKETWALIADLGFLILLHTRMTGWISKVQFIFLLPIAYLLVVMAWYGVNFILATGLHSYGFSSGGALSVFVFICLQFGVFLVGFQKGGKYECERE